MNRQDQLLLMDLNLAEYQREMTRWNADGEILEQDDLLLTRSPFSFPTTCVAMNLSAGPLVDAAETLDRIRSFYRKRRSSFSIHIRKHADDAMEDACRKEQMTSVSDATGMALTRPLPDQPAPKEIDIRHVRNIAGVNDFAFVIKDSFQTLRMPARIAENIFATPGRLLKPSNDLIVAYEVGRPVSVAMALYSHGIAGLYWVGTLQNKRCRGYAEACVREAANSAFRRGAVFVTLQASKFGEPLYTRMGFNVMTKYPWYVYFES